MWLSRYRIYLQWRRPGFDPLVGKIPWRRESLPTPVFWTEELYTVHGITLSNFHLSGFRVYPWFLLQVLTWCILYSKLYTRWLHRHLIQPILSLSLSLSLFFHLKHLHWDRLGNWPTKHITLFFSPLPPRNLKTGQGMVSARWEMRLWKML